MFNINFNLISFVHYIYIVSYVRGILVKKYIGEIGLFFTTIIWGTGFVGTKLSLEGGLTPLQQIGRAHV